MSLVSFSYDEEYDKVRGYLKSITKVREDESGKMSEKGQGRANIGPNRAYGYYTSGHTFKEGSETRIQWSSKFSIGYYNTMDTVSNDTDYPKDGALSKKKMR